MGSSWSFDLFEISVFLSLWLETKCSLSDSSSWSSDLSPSSSLCSLSSSMFWRSSSFTVSFSLESLTDGLVVGLVALWQIEVAFTELPETLILNARELTVDVNPQPNVCVCGVGNRNRLPNLNEGGAKVKFVLLWPLVRSRPNWKTFPVCLLPEEVPANKDIQFTEEINIVHISLSVTIRFFLDDIYFYFGMRMHNVQYRFRWALLLFGLTFCKKRLIGWYLAVLIMRQSKLFERLVTVFLKSWKAIHY